jgi:hypothetical protein
MTSPLVSTPHVMVYLDGILQSRVVAFNTRNGWIKRLRKNDDGEWVPEEIWGLVSADCDMTQQTTQAFGSGEGTI